MIADDMGKKEPMMPEKTILLVEDNPVDLLLLRMLLRHNPDYRVLEAPTVAEAMRQVQEAAELHLVLLDVQLPDGNGVDLCRQLKSAPATERIPVVLISAVEKDDDSISRGLDAGADGYLMKPIEGTALRAWLNATLRISALQRDLDESARLAPADDQQLLQEFAGLSHAVNNPLQSIMAAADLLSLDLEDHPQSDSILKEIQRYAEEASRLVARASMHARDSLLIPK